MASSLEGWIRVDCDVIDRLGVGVASSLPLAGSLAASMSLIKKTRAERCRMTKEEGDRVVSLSLSFPPPLPLTLTRPKVRWPLSTGHWNPTSLHGSNQSEISIRTLSRKRHRVGTPSTSMANSFSIGIVIIRHQNEKRQKR